MTTAVLVHGGWHSASCWDLVRAELAADGITSVAPQLPMTSTLDLRPGASSNPDSERFLARHKARHRDRTPE